MSSGEGSSGGPMRGSAGSSRRRYLRARTGTGGRPRPPQERRQVAPPVVIEERARAAPPEEARAVSPGLEGGPNIGAIFYAQAAQGGEEEGSPALRNMPANINYEELMQEMETRTREARYLRAQLSQLQSRVQEQDEHITRLVDDNSALHQELWVLRGRLGARENNLVHAGTQTTSSPADDVPLDVVLVVNDLANMAAEAEMAEADVAMEVDMADDPPPAANGGDGGPSPAPSPPASPPPSPPQAPVAAAPARPGIPPFKPFCHKKRRNQVGRLSDRQIGSRNRDVITLNNLYVEITRTAPAVPKALYRRVAGAFVGEGDAKFSFTRRTELTRNIVGRLRDIFVASQALARSRGRRTVIGSDVLQSLPVRRRR